MQEKRRSRAVATVCILSILFLGACNFMFSKPEEVPEILQTKDGIRQINEEVDKLWGQYMVNIENVKALSNLELKPYPLISSLGSAIWLYSADPNFPAHVEARSSKDRNVRYVFIFKPGTQPKWDKAQSTIEIDSNIFILHSSGWKDE